MPTGLRINIDRDSVCAGDSSDPHEAVIEVDPGSTVTVLLQAAWKACPLASISGGQATWLIDAGGVCIGVAAQQWSSPKLLVPADGAAAALFASRPATLHFRYWCQVNPDEVYEAVRSASALPPR